MTTLRCRTTFLAAILAAAAGAPHASAQEAEQKNPESAEQSPKRRINISPETIERMVEEGKITREQADRLLEMLSKPREGDGDGGGMRVTFGGAPAEDVVEIEVGQVAPPLSFDHVVANRPGWMPESGAPTWKDLRGKVVVLEVWATWCAPCVAAIPHLNEVASAVASEDVVFISISNEPVETIASFLEDREMASVVVSDPDGSTSAAYGVTSIPRTVIVDGDGKIAAVTHPKHLTVKALRTALDGGPLELPAPDGDRVEIPLDEPITITRPRPGEDDKEQEGDAQGG